MSYYKIKCLNCLRAMDNNQVLFRILIDELQDKEELIENEEHYSLTVDNNRKRTGGAMGAMAQSIFDDGKNDTRNPGDFVTSDELIKRCKYATPITKRAFVSKKSYINPDVTDDPYRGEIIYTDDEEDEVIIGYDLTELRIGEKYYNGKLTKRYCPFCHQKQIVQLIPEDAGTIPFFSVGLVGPSTAGKTTFLTFQRYAINKGIFKTELPDGKIIIENYFAHLQHYNDDIICLNANKVELEGAIPATTQGDKLPPPHCLKIKYRSNKLPNKDATKCVICFRDVLGELYYDTASKETDQKTTSLKKEVVDICRRADSMFVFTDPFVLNYFLVKVSEERRDYVIKDSSAKISESSTYSNSLDSDKEEAINKNELMVNKIIEIFKDVESSLEKPSVMILAKTDEIINNQNSLDFIDASSAVVAGNGEINYNDIGLWEDIFEDTKSVVQELDRNGQWNGIIENKFCNAVHIPVSAIGSDYVIVKMPEVKQGRIDFETHNPRIIPLDYWKRYLNSAPEERKDLIIEFSKYRIPDNGLKPRYISLPLIYLLMKFNIIPPYINKRYMSKGNESRNYDIFLKNFSMNKTLCSDTPVSDYHNNSTDDYIQEEKNTSRTLNIKSILSAVKKALKSK